jgi:hypothetical protein
MYKERENEIKVQLIKKNISSIRILKEEGWMLLTIP